MSRQVVGRNLPGMLILWENALVAAGNLAAAANCHSNDTFDAKTEHAGACDRYASLILCECFAFTRIALHILISTRGDLDI